MSSFCIRERISEIWFHITNRRLILIIFAAVLAVGMILGIVLACNGATDCSEQAVDNNTYVVIIVKGNFGSVFFRLFLYTLLIALCCCLCSIMHIINYVKFVLAFICGVYLGTYIVLAISCFGFVGIMIVLLFFVPEQLINALAFFVSYCDTEENLCRDFSISDIWQSNINALIIIAAALFVKLLLVFTLLKIFTALI